MDHLPDDIALPLETGRRWWHWLGGRPSVDLLNTRRERWRRDIETLTTPQDLTDWLHKAQLLDTAKDAAPAQLRSARRLRHAIDAAVIAVVTGEPVPTAAIAEINRQIPAATTSVLLHHGDAGHPTLAPAAPADPIEHALGLLAVDAASILGTNHRSRLRICAADRCSTRFYDASRAASRQWCSMATCGNAAKVRRHRARQHHDLSPSPLGS